MRFISRFLGVASHGPTTARRAVRGPHCQPLALEPLEDRHLLSVILWTNRGSTVSDTDNFTAVYGADATTARVLVDRAIDDWERVIDDFNYLSFGGLFEPIAANTYTLTIDAMALADMTLPGDTTINFVDTQGKPFDASIHMDDDGGGAGWFFDTTPQNDSEFTSLVGPYRAESGSSQADFYRAAAHEIGRAMGFDDSAGLAIQNFLVDPSIADPQDAAASLLSFFGAQVQTTLTTSGGLQVFEGPAPGGLATPVQPNDLMNPDRTVSGGGVRELISDLDAKVLADAYGYSINLPSTINTFYADLGSNGVLSVRGLPDDANDNVVIDNNGSLRVIVNGTEQVFNSAVTSISIQTFGGDDFIHVSADIGVPVSIDAGTGNDTIIGGSGPTTVVSAAGDGNDTIDLSHNPLGVSFIAHGGDRLIGTPFNDEFIVELNGALTSTTQYFDGGAGADRITLRQTGAATKRDETSVEIGALPGKGRVEVDDAGATLTLDFDNVEPITDSIPAVNFNITSVAGLASILQGANEITYQPGVLLSSGGRVTVDNFEPIEFDNQDNLEIDAGAGRDNVVLDNPGNPTNLQTITVDGDEGDDVITVLRVSDPAATTLTSIVLNGGAGNDRLDASAIAFATSVTLNGNAGNDTLVGGPGVDHYNGGAGDDTLVESPGDDLMSGDDGVDTLLVVGTALADKITLTQADAATLNVYLNGAASSNTVRLTEIVRVEAGAGDDLIGVSVSDSLITPGPPDVDGGSFAFQIVGDSPNASDRLEVRDDGPGDLVIQREGTDGRSGSVTVGPLKPVVYEGIEHVDVTPLDSTNGRTGTDGMGQLIVFHPDTKESNPSLLTATPLGPKPVFLGSLSIDPGPAELPGGFEPLPGDEDWFEFRPERTSTYRFDVLFDQIGPLANGRQGLPAQGDLQIEVYDDSGMIVASNDPGNNESLTIGMQANTSYYLRVLGSTIEGETGINVYDLNVTEVDLVGPQVTDVQIADDPATAADEGDYDLFSQKDPTQVSAPTPPIKGLTINLQDLSQPEPNGERAVGFAYPALDLASASQPGLYRLVGDNVGVIPIKCVVVTNNPVVPGQVATATVELTFYGALPDDRYTLTILDSIVDPPGNKLDGESNAGEPHSPPSFPSGNGVSGGDFVARFTVDSRPEIGVYLGTSVVIDANGNGTFDPNNADSANRDLVFNFGTINDQRLAGKLSPTQLPGYDVLVAYGRPSAGEPYRWLIDTNGSGSIDMPSEVVAAPEQINGLAVAGDFNKANPGDELAIFDGTTWHLYLNGPGAPSTPIATNLRGYPIAGDFNGDGNEDLGTYQNDTFYLDYGPAFDGVANSIISFGMPGTADRPVAADMDLDGIDDLGLWVPDAGAGQGTGEWRFLMSSDPVGLDHPFSPAPLGHDVAYKFGDPRALPIVGNFDPPASAAAASSAEETVTQLYQGILGRDPDPAGMAAFVAQMHSGATADDVAQALATSPEHYGQIVDSDYLDYLDRPADASGRQYWVDRLLGGMSEDDLAAYLLDSAEYSTKHASNTAFVDALYLDVLGRAADAGGRAAKLAVLASGQPRIRVIDGLIASPERAALVGRSENLAQGLAMAQAGAMNGFEIQAVVTGLYHDILNRAAGCRRPACLCRPVAGRRDARSRGSGTAQLAGILRAGGGSGVCPVSALRGRRGRPAVLDRADGRRRIGGCRRPRIAAIRRVCRGPRDQSGAGIGAVSRHSGPGAGRRRTGAVRERPGGRAIDRPGDQRFARQPRASQSAGAGRLRPSAGPRRRRRRSQPLRQPTAVRPTQPPQLAGGAGQFQRIPGESAERGLAVC